MNRLIISFLLVCVVIFVQAHEKKNRANLPYPSKYDNIDIDAIIGNDRIMKTYVDCCVDKKPCSADGRVLKEHMKDAIENKCDKCSEIQKKKAKKVIRKLIKDHPDWWQELCKYYNPDGKFTTQIHEMERDCKEGKWDNL